MSGIAGIIHFDRMPVQAADIERMTGAMPHRARNGVAHWVDGHVALGHCLLRTTVEAAEDRQPLVHAESGRVLVFDGRLDNHLELATELRGHGVVMRSLADSELVLRAYERWGRELLSHLDGDFAFAVWEPREQSLFCARDRVGNRPFHYHWNKTTFVFASDIRALLALEWVPRRLDLDFVAEALAMEWSSTEETYWQEIRRLRPSHALSARREGLRTHRYWLPALDLRLPCRSDEDYVQYYRSLLFDVVRRMGRSSGPVACEVSGGLDSSAVFAVASDLQRRGEWPAPDVHGYTLDFRGAGDADELDFAQEVAAHVGRPITAVPPTRHSLDWYESWAARERYPAGAPNGVMGLGIRETARSRGSTCLLVGVGGDEWLDGQPTYYAEFIERRRWPELWATMRRDSCEIGAARAAWWLFRYGVMPLSPAGFRHAYHDLRRRLAGHDRWLSRSMRQRLKRRTARALQATRPLARVGQRSLLLQVDGAFSLLARESEELHCAVMGLEIRRPFWSPRIIEFVLSTPECVRRAGNATKVMHRKAMAGLLPEVVRQRVSKAEFTVTFHWSTGEIRDRLGHLPPPLGDWIDAGHLRRVLREYGEPGGSGWAEWQAWSLFDCYTLTRPPTLDPWDRHGVATE